MKTLTEVLSDKLSYFNTDRTQDWEYMDDSPIHILEFVLEIVEELEFELPGIPNYKEMKIGIVRVYIERAQGATTRSLRNMWIRSAFRDLTFAIDAYIKYTVQ